MPKTKPAKADNEVRDMLHELIQDARSAAREQNGVRLDRFTKLMQVLVYYEGQQGNPDWMASVLFALGE